MVSLPTGSDKLLEVRTAYVDIVIKTKGKQNAGAVVNGDASSSLKVVASDIKRISVPVQEMSEEYFDHEGMAVHEFKVKP